MQGNLKILEDGRKLIPTDIIALTAVQTIVLIYPEF